MTIGDASYNKRTNEAQVEDRYVKHADQNNQDNENSDKLKLSELPSIHGS